MSPVRFSLTNPPDLQALPSATMETNDFTAGMRRTEVRYAAPVCCTATECAAGAVSAAAATGAAAAPVAAAAAASFGVRTSALLPAPIMLNMNHKQAQCKVGCAGAVQQVSGAPGPCVQGRAPADKPAVRMLKPPASTSSRWTLAQGALHAAHGWRTC